MEHDSVTRWLRQMSEGDQDAARRLWNRYSSALMRLTKGHYRGAVTAAADEEDLVQSVFHALWRGATAGRLDTVKDRSELWWLLLAITRRKAVNRRDYNAREKRGGGHMPLNQSDSVPNGSTGTPPLDVADDQPPPDLLLMLEEEQQQLLACLRDDVLRSIAVWKLEGYSHDEIAQKMKVTRRTVIRKINLIRETWSQELQP